MPSAPTIRPASAIDSAAIRRVYLSAFGDQEGLALSTLVGALARDATAQPLLSLVAAVDSSVVGHVLFTRARIESDDSARHRDCKASLLAPLAVDASWQRRGIGTGLVQAGFDRLAAEGVSLVFVLGHPSY